MDVAEMGSEESSDYDDSEDEMDEDQMDQFEDFLDRNLEMYRQATVPNSGGTFCFNTTELNPFTIAF